MRQSGAAATSRYVPYQRARRPGGRPDQKPLWRVLVHRKCADGWDELVQRVGLQSAQRTWDHLAMQPDRPPDIGQCTKLRGMDAYAKDGWSPIYHYEASSMVRLDYQYHAGYQTGSDSDPHPVVRVLRIEFSSH